MASSSSSTTTLTDHDENGNAISLDACPICGSSPVQNEVCPASCGSLEGLFTTQDDDLLRRCPSRTFAYDWANGYVAPFLGVDEDAAKRALLAAGIRKEDSLVDLGCGDGRICGMACEIMDAAKADGFDLDEELIGKARKRANDMDATKRPSFYVQDLFQVPLDSYTVITMFLLPQTTETLVSKLHQELLSGKNCRVISFGWPIKGLGEPASSWVDNNSNDDNKCNSKGAVDRWFLYNKDSLEGERMEYLRHGQG
jgi:SAM-dependent methyltransferase